MRMPGLRERTKKFSLRVIRVCTSLPATMVGQTLGRQLLRSGTSVAANFREASRARTRAEFIAKFGIVEQELDETALWLELLTDADVVVENKLSALHQETEELIKIVITTIKRSRTRA